MKYLSKNSPEVAGIDSRPPAHVPRAAPQKEGGKTGTAQCCGWRFGAQPGIIPDNNIEVRETSTSEVLKDKAQNDLDCSVFNHCSKMLLHTANWDPAFSRHGSVHAFLFFNGNLAYFTLFEAQSMLHLEGGSKEEQRAGEHSASAA